MKIIARINIDTPEGREIVERLRKYPEEVSFEENIVTEPETAYETSVKIKENEFYDKDEKKAAPEGYMTLEEFRNKMHDFVKKQYDK